jgi:hypothetical protein
MHFYIGKILFLQKVGVTKKHNTKNNHAKDNLRGDWRKLLQEIMSGNVEAVDRGVDGEEASRGGERQRPKLEVVVPAQAQEGRSRRPEAAQAQGGGGPSLRTRQPKVVPAAQGGSLRWWHWPELKKSGRRGGQTRDAMPGRKPGSYRHWR